MITMLSHIILYKLDNIVFYIVVRLQESSIYSNLHGNQYEQVDCYLGKT